MIKRLLNIAYLQIKIEIRNCNLTAIPLIKGIHHADTGQGTLLKVVYK